jgi:gliding motility-associated-like protein
VKISLRLAFFIAFFLSAHTIWAVNRYWIGQSGDWNNPVNWSAERGGSSGASVPQSIDDAFIFPQSGQLIQINLSETSVCRSLQIGTPYEKKNEVGRVQLKGSGTFTLQKLICYSHIQDEYTGTWIFDKETEINTNGNVFSSKFIFTSPQKTIVASDLYVNNTIELKKGTLSIFPSAKILATDLKQNPPATIENKEGLRLVNSSLSLLNHTVTTSIVPGLCNGDCDATATANVTGGSGSYSYLWSPGGQTTQTATSLCAGTYLVVVTDLVSGDQIPAFAIVIEPPPLVIFFSNTLPFCFGQCNASSSAIIAGGTPNYTYSWAPGGQTTPAVTGLCAGTYSLTITDGNGCQITQTSVITEPDILLANGSSTNITCNNACDGTATVAPTGGTGPYTYSWSPTGQTVASIGSLCPGVYTCIVNDFNNCSVTYTATITQPPPVVVNTTSTNASCFGNCNGTASSTVSGGVGPYVYSWAPGGQTTASVNGLCAGSYTVTVTDSRNCSTQRTVTITEPPQLVLAPSVTNISCFGSCDGAAVANASGGTPSYTYNWQPSGGTSASASNLCEGTYTLTVTDSKGCQVNTSVVITEPDLLTAQVSSTDIPCNTTCTGSATVTPTGGTSPYTYNWTPGNFTTASISNLCTGTYTVTVRDAKNCLVTKTVTIIQPQPVSASVTGTNTSCNSACDGSASVTVTGGVAPFTYQWLPGGETSASINNLCAGIYTVNVTDAQGCILTETISITEPNLLTVSVNTTQLICNNTCNATAAAVVSGGTPSYAFLWQPGGQTTPTISNLCAGTYTVIVTDSKGCTANKIFIVTQPPSFQVTTTITDVQCAGQCNGSASITVSGATSPYTYSWSPGGQTTASITGLCAGNYSCTIVDDNGCDTTVIVNIIAPQALSANTTAINPSCTGACDGSITANPAGGVGPYTFFWAPGGQTTASITGLCTGTYTVTVRDANNCSAFAAVNITQPQILSAAITSTTASCGLCDGSATVNVSGGSQPYTYAWSPSGGSGPTATGLCQGSYTCTIADANGCATNVTVQIIQQINIVVTSSGTTLNCYNACDAFASATASGGLAPYTYTWNPGNVSGQNISNLCVGSYTVTATDQNGCSNTASVAFVNPPQLQIVKTFTDATCFGLCDGTASVTPSGGTGGYTYLWQPGNQNSSSVTGLCAGTYSVTIKDANNCDTTVSFTISNATLLVANPSVTLSNCTLCDGAIATAPSGGTTPYTYSWSPGGQTSSGIANLCAGIYTVTITDALGCMITSPIAVGNVTGPTLTSSATNASCKNSCDGSATVTVVSGITPFTYDWSPGTPVGDGTTSVSGLCAGPVFTQVTDGNGCISFANEIITDPDVLTANGVITPANCFGACTGAITVTATGGTEPYTYSWSSGGTGATVTGLCAGTYTLNLTDSKNCTQTLTFTVTQPSALGSTTTTTPALCSGECTGSATVTPTGGTTPYTYSWSNGPIVPVINNLCQGSYTVTVRDANHCIRLDSVTITEPQLLSAVITTNDVNCAVACNGSATVAITGGTPGYTTLWAPGGQTTTSVSNLCSGAYSLTVFDGNGCATIAIASINEPSPIVLTVSSIQTSCVNDCDGSATVVASGGTPQYTYSWLPSGQTTASASGLCAGIYTVTVTDLNGCTATETVTVNDPAPLQANTSYTSPSCDNVCNGTATSAPIGGTNPYTFLWAPGGQTTASITNVCAGTYTVTVRDANGCSQIQNFTVLPAPPISLAVSSVPATCGVCNGSITTVPSGGTGTFTFSWSNGLPATAAQSNLCAGLYSVTVTDGTSCSSTFTIPINNSNGPSGETISTSDVTCYGDCNGSATVLPIGGTLPYTYLWSPGGQTTNTLTGMCAGNYFMQVTDSNSCIRFAPVTINSPLPIQTSPFVVNTSCTGICDGAIELNTNGGSASGYTYNWLPSGQTTDSISGLCTGTYTVNITDLNGCTGADTITVNPFNTLSAVITSTPELCSNTCAATATAQVTGGAFPFTYQWNDPIAQTAQTAVGLCPGTYSVTVTDNNGCNAQQTVSIADPQAITVNPVITATSCGSCNGSIVLNASGGAGGFSYLWNTGASTDNLSGLCAGVYSVTIFDLNNCSSNFQFIITNSNGPSASNPVITNSSCSNACDGAITIAPAGGTPPYTYLWLPGNQTTTTISNLCAGTYTVQIMDAAGCQRIDSFSVTAPNTILVNPTIINTECGFCGGSIALNPSGGNGSLTFSWQPGGETTPTITNLCAGLYTVTITDSIGCQLTRIIPVSNTNSTVTISTISTAIRCAGDCNGTAIAFAGGSTGSYTFNWSNGSTNDSLNGLCPGIYLIQVADAAGCISTAQAIVDDATPLYAAFPIVTDARCAGDCNGSIALLPGGGTIPYSFTWSEGQTINPAINLCAGTYSVTITDGNGCALTRVDSIDQPTALTAANPVINNASCNTVADGAIDISINGGTSPYAYNWNGPNGFNSAAEDLINLFPGIYAVITTDSSGCTRTDSVNLASDLVVLADAGADTKRCFPNTVVLDGTRSTNAVNYLWYSLPGMNQVGNTVTATISPPTGINIFILEAENNGCKHLDTVAITMIAPPDVNAGSDITIFATGSTTIGGNPAVPNGLPSFWSPANGLNDSTLTNPLASPQSTTTYILNTIDTNGCIGSDTMILTVLPEISFPNGFTPNGDGVNDVWQIDNIQLFRDCEVEVYDRWGILLFRSVGYTTPWDGHYNNDPLPVGTYYYVIKLNDPLFPEPYTGPITIMR